jgi:hypothetical protein
MKKLETDIWRKVLKWVDDCPTKAIISSFSGQTLHLNVSINEKDLKKGKTYVDNTSRVSRKS